MNNTIEIVVPCYGYGHFLRECVGSILTQSWRDLTVVIVNDASPDDTASIADGLAADDSRVSVVHHPINRGHIASYNEALERTSADYTLILSPDDVLTPGALDRAVAAFRQYPSAALCYGRDIPFKTGESLLPPQSGDGGVVFERYERFVDGSCELGHTPIQAPTAVMRTSVQRTLGGFLPDLPHTADTEIWLRLAAEGGVVKVEADQAYRRLHDANMSLDYSEVARLKEQRRAFAVHFTYMGDRLANRVALEQRVCEAIGTRSFWSAVRAFDRGDKGTFASALEFAVEAWPPIVKRPEYVRLRLKRMFGMRAWNRLQPWLRRSHHGRRGPRAVQPD